MRPVARDEAARLSTEATYILQKWRGSLEGEQGGWVGISTPEARLGSQEYSEVSSRICTYIRIRRRLCLYKDHSPSARQVIKTP